MTLAQEAAELMKEAVAEITKLRQEKADLLENLEIIASFATGEGDVCEIIAKRARAAIAKAEAR